MAQTDQQGLVVKVKLDASTAQHLLSHKPRSLATATFCSLLIEQGLTGWSKLPAYCVGAGTSEKEVTRTLQDEHTQQARMPAAGADGLGACLQEEDSQEPKKKGGVGGKKNCDPFSKRVISEDLVPAEISDCAALIVEFWAVKKGTRSERVWNRICDKLRGWPSTQRHEALHRAIAAGWGDVFEPPVPRSASPNQPPEPSRHPAGRLFQNGRFVDEESPTTNPVLSGLF